ncbi:response regulator [Paenibacillus macerans]|uniref:response regulator n=1 Tax=Paenibacillus macerans TaxID=44252 RepID=UPI003D318E81
MYKLIVVDDEDEVREGIRLKTDWAACGFELAGDYANGRDALEAVHQFHPDVILTDICMPFMDGLELAEQVAGRYRDIRIVIVTGYEHFEYAQQAIRLKVNDYLLKPVNLEELTDFLRRMRSELDEERAHREDLNRLRRRLNESLPLMRERFLERMVTSRLNEAEINEKLAYYQIDLCGPAYLALVADLDDPVPNGLPAAQNLDQDELLRFAAFNIFEEVFAKERGGFAFGTRDDKIGLLLAGDPQELESAAQTAAEQAGFAVHKYLKRSVSIGIGRPCRLRSELAHSYREAASALEYRFLHGRGRVLGISDVEYGKPGLGGHTGYGELEKRLAAALKTGKADLVSQALEEGFGELRRSLAAPRRCYAAAHRMLALLIQMIVDAGFDDGELFGEDPFSGLPPIQTLGDLQSWLDDCCRRVLAYLSERRAGVSEWQIEEALRFIREHYGDPELNLGRVCRHVYLSTSYFSALFKQHAGCTFVEYLTRLRIDKAKELLALTRLKTYDVAGKVGYGDPQYFSVIFKRVTGVTPKEYRSALKESR